MENEKEDYIKVAIRIRPDLSLDNSCKECLKVILQESNTDPPVVFINERQQPFSFDNVFTESSSQLDVYNHMVKPLVEKLIEGYNCTVFAYGQTGTGKTYTIGTNFGENDIFEVDAGLIYRTLQDILNQNNENKQVKIEISFFEIYNEKVYDLLNSNKNALQVQGTGTINGLTKREVATFEEVQSLLFDGGKNRHTAETKKNHKSSRSHAIFRIHCKVQCPNYEREGILNLVDLAGSESIKKTGNEGKMLHEGININKGLLCIGQVIYALSLNKSFIPYRQSTITTILQDSLSKKNFISLIACVVSNMDDLHETTQTLEFAQRAKKLRSKPQLNSIAHEFYKTNQQFSARNTRSYSARTPYNRPIFKQPGFKTPLRSVSTSDFSHFKPKFRYLPDFQNLTGSARSKLYESISSISTINDINLSPLVRKCIESVENKIIDKLEDIVNTMQTPARPVKRCSCKTIKNELVQIVQDEFKSFHDVSNLIQNCSAEISDISNDEVQNSEENSPNFKIPELPTRKKSSSKNLVTSSPIHSPNKLPRRSTRLSTMFNKTMVVSPEKENSRNRKKNVTSSPKTIKKKKVITAASKQIGNNIKFVLKTINSGEIKEICKLCTIGTKRAMMIHNYWLLNGEYKKITDLKKVLLTENSYNKFVKTNFLE